MKDEVSANALESLAKGGKRNIGTGYDKKPVTKRRTKRGISAPKISKSFGK